MFPIDPDAVEKIWGLTPATLRSALNRGYVRVTPGTAHQPYTISYLTTPNIKLAEAGQELKVIGTRPDGSKILTPDSLEGGLLRRPRRPRRRAAAGVRTRLKRPAHDAPHAGIMGESDLMLDTHAVARSLTAADFTPAQADALTDALRLVVEQGDHVTSDQFKVGMAEMRAHQRTEIAEVRTEIAGVTHRDCEPRYAVVDPDQHHGNPLDLAHARHRRARVSGWESESVVGMRVREMAR